MGINPVIVVSFSQRPASLCAPGAACWKRDDTDPCPWVLCGTPAIWQCQGVTRIGISVWLDEGPASILF